MFQVKYMSFEGLWLMNEDTFELIDKLAKIARHVKLSHHLRSKAYHIQVSNKNYPLTNK